MAFTNRFFKKILFLAGFYKVWRHFSARWWRPRANRSKHISWFSTRIPIKSTRTFCDKNWQNERQFVVFHVLVTLTLTFWPWPLKKESGQLDQKRSSEEFFQNFQVRIVTCRGRTDKHTHKLTNKHTVTTNILEKIKDFLK